MSREKGRPRDPDDAELEREVRERREFSLSEAIGRAAGDLMKGTSPVTRERQAEVAIELYLEDRLADAAGALAAVLARRVLAGEALLAAGYERPLEALAEETRRLVTSEPRLRRLVSEVDAEWGRMYSERPRFQRPGSPPRADDPYTVASVRASLERLLEELRAASAEAGP